MAAAANADDYTNGRLNMFFPANNNTPADGNLTGQCVTLVKWFMAEMASVPSPFAARGDARYVGHQLVAEGLAVEVPYAQRRRGDIICYEYGTYGHIGVVLSGDRTFEENVNWPGVQSKIVDGDRVFASRIGGLGESWRHDQHIYRLKSYNEGGADDMIAPTEQEVYGAFRKFAGMEPANPAQVQYYMARDKRDLYADLLNYEVVPDAGDVEKAFADFTELKPTPDQIAYYTDKPFKALYADLLTYYDKNNPSKNDLNKTNVLKYLENKLT